MHSPISFSLTLFAAVAMAASTLPKPMDTDPIARLDECIQRRFVSTRSFGMSRVLPNQFHGIEQFQPENGVETQVVSELRQKGYRVAVFLAGRHVLDAPAPLTSSRRFGLQGPAYVANVTAAADLPGREMLLAESRLAMKSLTAAGESGAGYDVRRGDWVVAIRPLRASNQSCVMCHTSGFGALVRDGNHPTKMGDAIGVAMYVYRRPAA